jgi:hypothetical protein
MRALTMDEVGVVSGGYELHTYEDAQGGGLATLGITGYRPTPAQPTYNPTNNYSTPSFYSPSLMYGSVDSMNWCAPVNGGFASQDAQLQCYADWLNAGSPDIQGQTEAEITDSGNGRAGGHWVQEYHKPAVPGSGDTSTFELAMALGGFMGTLVPGLEPGLIITGPVFMDKLMKWLTGN